MKKVLLIFLLVISVVRVASAQDSTPVRCGDIIENEFKENQEAHYYTLDLQAGTQITVTGSPLGDTLSFTLSVYAPNGNNVAYNYSFNTIAEPEKDPVATSGVLSANGTYTLIAGNERTYLHDGGELRGSGAGGVGVYTLYIGCTLRDGTVIKPGDVLPDNAGSGATGSPPPPPPAFSGFGFPGAMAVDFSTGIEIPIQPGQSQTAPIRVDIALYTYDASAGSTATLSLSRVSGDISIGVAVINKADNNVIFLGGMPSSNNLSVELTFPTDGTYAIGLFRLDTATVTGTSGAVQITIQ